LGGIGKRTGLRKKLADAIPVHTTFISQVLNCRADLSLEQAEVVNAFLGHSDSEGDYFMLLLMRDRAGSVALRRRFEVKLSNLKADFGWIANRIGPKKEISKSDQEKFYSSYLYGLIHVLASIPQFDDIEVLASRLSVSRAKVKEAVEFLLSLGLLVRHKGRLGVGSQHIHLPGNAELITRHHSNWRVHALSNLQNIDKTDIHYSACMSLSADDAELVKESILKNLKANVDIISKSPSEVAYVMNLDFYRT
jgi:uncharacterized protein (TIGR02147 family)